MRIQPQLRLHECGGVLIVGLLSLIMLTAIGIAATTSSITENDITANELRQKEAFYAAELALKVGEQIVAEVSNIHDLYDPNIFKENVKGHYQRDQQPPWNKMMWDKTDSAEIPASAFPVATAPGTLGYPKFAAPLRYTIAERFFDVDSFGIGLKVPTGVNLFSVAGQGTGGTKNSKTLVRSIYVRRLG